MYAEIESNYVVAVDNTLVTAMHSLIQESLLQGHIYQTIVIANHSS